jgi:hypothetical protein
VSRLLCLDWPTLGPQADAEIARAVQPKYIKEVVPMCKRNFLFSILVLSISLGGAQTLCGQEPPCMPNSNFPSGYVPFSSIYYISGPDTAGDLLVVGSMTMTNFLGLNLVPLPNNTSGNQLFCNPITLAPGMVANAYVPTAVERIGDFSAFRSILFDPACTEGCPIYFPDGTIPPSSIPSVFAWRIPAKQPGPPVYVSTGSGGQILAVDGSSGVTSVLFSSESSSDLEGLAVGPDNLIYFTDPEYGEIYRIDQRGGSLRTVYEWMGEGSPGPGTPQGPSFSTTRQLTFNTTDHEGVWQISFDSLDNSATPTQIIPPENGATEGAGTTFNHADELLIVDQYSPAVLQQTAPGLGSTTTLISSDYLYWPFGIAVSSSGNIFVSDFPCSEETCSGVIWQFDSAGQFVNTYVSFISDQPMYLQFDASDKLYVVTISEGGGKVWRVDPSGTSPPTGTATLLIDLGYAFSNGTVPNLNGSSAVGVALPGTSFTTPPQQIVPGTPLTFTYGNITNQTISLPSDVVLNGTASIAVNFQQWDPTLFDTTRLPATGTNAWSGGTPVLSGTTCTPIAGTGGNCIVIQDLCFDSTGARIFPCNITIGPSGTLIGLSSKYQTQSSQPNPGLIIADDGKNNWANITSGYSPLDPTISGRTKALNTDTAIVSLGPGIVSPSSIDFGTVYLGTITIKSMKVSNPGPGPMTIQNPFISLLSGGNSKEFAAVNLCPKSLAAGKSCRIDVAFLAGPNYTLQTAILKVVDSAPDSPQTVPLSATVINPKASLSSYSLNFGKQKLSTTSVAKSVKLTNTGTTPLVLSTLTVSGKFALGAGTKTCVNGETLTPSASCMIDVTFSPTAKGPQCGSVVITDNARNSPQRILLSGTGYY